jgi:hypothetical protein
MWMHILQFQENLALRAEREREERAREHREERRELLQQLTALSGRPVQPSYRIGAALASFRSFNGTSEDGAIFLTDVSQVLGTHQIPEDMWPREVFLKLTDVAKAWYTNRFQHLMATEFPSWGELYAAILDEYSRPYQAAAAFHALHGATRVPGSTGPEALARVAALQTALSRKGVPVTAGVNEQYAYILQNQLHAGDELTRWTSLANACEAISDATLNELELRSVEPKARRHTCSPAEREQFFALRVAHLTNYLREQGSAADDRRPGPTRAAVIKGVPAAPLTATPALNLSTPPGPPPAAPASPAAGPAHSMTELECRIVVARSDRVAGAGGKGRPHRIPQEPPTYFGHDQAKNLAEFAKRQACNACFACTMAEVEYSLFHTLCPRHGRDSTAQSRANRVPGSCRAV